MNSVNVMKATFEDGREAQYQEMMQELARMQAKYKGVRGDLLEKVRAELSALKPSRPAHRVPAPTPPVAKVTAPPAKVTAPAAKVTAEKISVEKVSAEKVALQKPVEKASAQRASAMLPSCRLCGRGMKLDEAGNNLVCDKGHTRAAS